MAITRGKFLTPLSRSIIMAVALLENKNQVSKNVEIGRILSYADWFYKTYLIAYFEIEEKYELPVLGNGNDLVKRALKEHRKLRRLFDSINQEQKDLGITQGMILRSGVTNFGNKTSLDCRAFVISTDIFYARSNGL